MSKHSPPRYRSGHRLGPAQAGFGLSEVIVAMAIGVIGMLAIMQAMAVNERYRQNTIGTSGAQSNGSVSLFTIERDVRTSGYGIASNGTLGCSSVQYYYNGGYTDPPGGGSATLPPLLLVPAIITQGTGTAPDSIAVLSSTSTYRFAPATLISAMTNSASDLQVDDVTGFAVGDMVAVTQGTVCALMQITQIDSVGLKLQHATNSVTAPFNPPSGSSLPTFSTGAQVYDLGAPIIRSYSITNNNLTVANWLSTLQGNAPIVTASEIVDLQAEYGIDDGSGGGTPDDGIVDVYSTATPTSAAGWKRVLNMRIGLLARGAYEKPDASGTCTSTTTNASQKWAGGVLTIPPAPGEPGGLPSCYTFRTFETVIPIRNMIWKDS